MVNSLLAEVYIGINKAARSALPLIALTNSLMLTSSFVEDVQHMRRLFAEEQGVEAIVVETSERIHPLVKSAVPRYLEAIV